MQGNYPREATITEKTADILNDDYSYISPSYTRDFDFVVEGGHGREVIDVEGNYYLDFGAGIAVTSTGHCHPKVVRAIQHQAAKLIHMSGTDFYYNPQIDLAKKLSNISTGAYENDRMCFFGNSGAEAVEAAMKLARFHTRRPGFIAFTGAFHGRTFGAMSLTGSKAIQKLHYQPLQPVVHAPYADCHECMFKSTAEECQKDKFQCLTYLEEQIFDRVMPEDDVAAVFVEAIQGEGGYIIPPDGWLETLRHITYDRGILLVIDEIQSGIGRTGKWLAHHHTDIDADMICVAKGIASGMPLGVMIASGNLMDGWETGSHASTFGGNPIACAAALKTLEVIEDEGLMENATAMGEYLHSKLLHLESNLICVANSRGRGLMRATDIVGEVTRDEVIETCFEKGLILLGCGKTGIRFCPALNVTKEEIDMCIMVLEESIKEVI